MNKPIYSKLVGVKFPEIQANISLCNAGDELTMIRELDNRYDTNAIRVYNDLMPLGYINRDLASKIAPRIDNGVKYMCTVQAVTGGGEKLRGVNIALDPMDSPESITTDKTDSNEYTLFDMDDIIDSIIEEIEFNLLF